MHDVSRTLSVMIEKYYPLLVQLATEPVTARPVSGGWSRQQELGHLVDSALNNIQRFIRVQYQTSVKVSYDADEWVRANDYNRMPWPELVELWYLLNKRAVRILDEIPVSLQDKPVDVGATEPVIHPLSFIAEDYVSHMRHHLHHILSPEGPNLA